MKVLQVHNRYRLRGGEDAVVENTLAALERHGHEALLFEADSAGAAGGLAGKVRMAAGAIWSPPSRARMLATLERERPDVVHVHNLYPLLSPAVLAACKSAGVPVVMTCHNYRLTCPIGIHFTAGAVCEKCRGGHDYWCLIRNCRDSRTESAAYALRNFMTGHLNLFERNIDKFLCISEFLKSYLVESGYPAAKFTVVPNMIPIPESAADASEGSYVAFLGRFSAEKGIETLLAAAEKVPHIPVKLAGSGPLEDALRAAAPANVSFAGMMDRDGLRSFYRSARCTVVPSVWHETFGLVAVEAMSHGVPVVASKIGGLAELVADGETGFQFPAGDSGALARHLETLWSDPALAGRLGAAGRAQVAAEYSEARYVARLEAVYEEVVQTAKRRAA